MKLCCWNHIIITIIFEWSLSVFISLSQWFLLGSENSFFHRLWLIAFLRWLVSIRRTFFYVSYINALRINIFIFINIYIFLLVIYIISFLCLKSWSLSFIWILILVILTLNLNLICSISIIVLFNIYLWGTWIIIYCLISILIRFTIVNWDKSVRHLSFFEIIMRGIGFGVISLISIIWN